MAKTKPNIAVVFDFDGTLINSKIIKNRNYQVAFEIIFGSPKSARSKIIKSSNKTSGANRFIQLEDTLNTLGFSATEEQKQKWSALYSKLNKKSLKSIREFPSVRNVLRNLVQSGYDLFLASGILDSELKEEIRRRKITHFFKEIRGGDKLGFIQNLKKRNYRKIFFIGDSIYDEMVAKEASVEFYMVSNDRDIRCFPIFLKKRTSTEGKQAIFSSKK